MRALSKTLLLVPAVALAVGLALHGLALAQSQPQLLAAYRPAPLPLADPAAPLWAGLQGQTVPLTAQAGIAPALSQASIAAVEVKAVHDGQWIAFLLSWPDNTQDTGASRLDDFPDAAAVEVTPGAGIPSICMGLVGQPLNLWHWKASWQKDLDDGFQEVLQAYPNFWGDFYPYVVGKPPFRFPQDWTSAEARALVPAWEAGNPLANPQRVTAVEDLNAEGFGTLTTQTTQDVLGRGVWQNGRWYVTFARTLATGDANDSQLAAGDSRSVAFAIWNGSNEEAGARKQLSAWVTVALDKVQTAAPPPAPVQAVAPTPTILDVAVPFVAGVGVMAAMALGALIIAAG
ncbi:MAG: hypothetical protein IT330_14265, partial [Anaerolineae bacterium]|nr:hypothetical protein [Anaerolineae bacterium]